MFYVIIRNAIYLLMRLYVSLYFNSKKNATGVISRTKHGKLDSLSAVKAMSDGDIQNLLKQYGVDPGPITDRTRVIYERELAKDQPHQPSVSVLRIK